MVDFPYEDKGPVGLMSPVIARVAEMHREAGLAAPARTVSVVAAELEHAQEQAARVKPLREELDRLLGRKSRARKGGAK